MDNSKWAEPCFCCQTQYVITNAVPLCGICNSSKGTRLPQDFYTALQMQQIQQKFIEAEKLKESKFENKEERNNE